MNERVIPARMKTQRWSSNERTAQRMGGDIQYDYGFRIYNPAIAKFLSVDPLSPDYPMLTPYQFASNSPIWAVDLDGLEASTTNSGSDAEANWWIQGMAQLVWKGMRYQDYIERNGGYIGRATGAYEYKQGDEEMDFIHGMKTAVELATLTNVLKDPTDVHYGYNLSKKALRRSPDVCKVVVKESDDILSKIQWNATELGRFGERAQAMVYGKAPKANIRTFKTSNGGKRIFDNLQNKTGFESKVGFKRLSSGDGNSTVKKQLEKDLELLKKGDLEAIVWTFYRSPQTGKVGASDDVLKFFKDAQDAGWNLTHEIGDLPTEAIENVMQNMVKWHW